MASKFYQKPQLGQAQTSSAQQTSLPSHDQQAQGKADQAARGIDMLHNLAQGITDAVYKGYTENEDAKNRLASANERPAFIRHVQSQIEATEDYETLGAEGLKNKYREFSESFMEGHKDKPYTQQLRKDLAAYSPKMLENMFQQRDSQYSTKVTNLTTQAISDATQEYGSSLTSHQDYIGILNDRIQESMIAHQTPASAKIINDDDTRGRYQGLTLKQAQNAAMKGVMIQLGNPESSRLAKMVHTQEFMDVMGVNSADPEYQKLANFALRKGEKADSFNYTQGLDNFKESLYTQTNMGVSVDVDKRIAEFRATGKPMTAKDEHKIRKEFKDENSLVVNTRSYLDNLSKEKGAYDSTIGMKKKEAEAIHTNAIYQVLDLPPESRSLNDIAGVLTNPAKADSFIKYVTKSGSIPESFKRKFDVVGTDPERWEEAQDALLGMSSAVLGTGKSVTTLIGAERVGKIRAFSHIESDKSISIEDKQEQRNILSSDYAKLNSRGYIKSIPNSTVDMDKLSSAAQDANWTTDPLSGYTQNLEMIKHYALMNERIGMSGEDATSLAVEQFDDGHSQHENPDGTEIAIPVEHRNLNPTGLKMFARGNADLAARIAKDNLTFRVDRRIGMRKAPDFNVSKAYILTYDGSPVTDARFTYEDYSDYIGQLPHKMQREVNRKLNKSRKEYIQDALEVRQKRIKQIGTGEEYKLSYGQFDFTFIE